MGDTLFSWIAYPKVLGSDVAGEVVEVGSGVTRFKIGDRVLGHAVGLRSNKGSNGAFQAYTVLLAHMASPIPSTLSYESAAVIPLGLSTAASGLFREDYLALQHPLVSPKPTGKALFVCGGATSVGSNAIQLAVAAGYEVITTASPKNFEYVKKLGASQVFDYHSKTIVDKLAEAFDGKTIAGAICIAGEIQDCFEVVARSEGNKFVAMAQRMPEKLPGGVGTKFIFAGDIKDSEVNHAIYRGFLPKALAEGQYIAAPGAEVVGKGLEYTQAGFDLQKKGMSAKKAVISL